MSRHLIVLVEGSPEPRAAIAWATRAAGESDTIELVAPWRRGQTEVDPRSGRIVDAPTAAHLRLLREFDRARTIRPTVRLRLRPLAGSPLELLPKLGESADLIVLAGNPPSRWLHRQPRKASLLRSTECPVVVVSATSKGPEITAQGLRQDDDYNLLDRLIRP